jgi:phospholipid/cholesterol/gamma-HCH transport system substrate-binding protein
MSVLPESPTTLPPEVVTPVKHLEVKAALLLGFMLLLVTGSVMYLMYARGAFEKTQRLILMTDNSEGVIVGMDMTFAGFPIGRVRRVELSDQGRARILLDVPSADAHWLRQSSVFTLEHGLVGGTHIRAFTGMLSDKPLDDGAVREAHRGDAAEAIPLLLSSVRDVVANVSAMTAEEASLRSTLRNLKVVTEKLKGPQGVLGVAMGNEADAHKIVEVINRSNALLSKVDSLVLKADGLAAKAEVQIFGPKGVMTDTQATVQQLNGLLADARNSLKKVDGVLVEAQAIAVNTKEATVDLGTLRADVEASLRKVDGLVNEINRKWPFARDTELKLP